MLITESIICNLWHQDRPLLPLCCQTLWTVLTSLLLLLLLLVLFGVKELQAFSDMGLKSAYFW